MRNNTNTTDRIVFEAFRTDSPAGLIRYDVIDTYLDREALSATREKAFNMLLQSTSINHEGANRLLAAAEANLGLRITIER